ncbi:MAG: hypothetical protein RMM29_06475 [Planctomycetota bacterium]|nr:hypothetical protein [Planctomycetota bacterium]
MRRAVLICSLSAAIGWTADLTDRYTAEELAAGKDISEHIYGSHGAGEFDEWRVHLGFAPGIDRIEVKAEVNGRPYPGPARIESDDVINEPAMPPRLGVEWLLGDFDDPRQGWFVTLGLEFTMREYLLVYGIGATTRPLDLYAATASVGMGYAWYWGPTWRWELQGFLNGGMMWTQLEVVDLTSRRPQLAIDNGPQVEAGSRFAAVWHPSYTQAWHVGALVDYRVGYAQTIYHNDVEIVEQGVPETRTMRGEFRFRWHGFGYGIFFGHRF